ncbi:spore germination protein GerPB [Heyndrickxia sp. NPDC080065]|uniref:spore germination protein GerPB n=1 Tax=Heyndrickxia sp. NPDC080065 TaxID=3390568 RepID=UPI003D006F02
MKIYVQQNIQIRMIKIGGITNSSVFQIGTAGIIKPVSHLFDTGCFTGPAPVAGGVPTEVSAEVTPAAPPETPILVPLRNDDEDE